MSKYSPKIDLVFRKLFGSEENTDLLLSLINGVIDCQPRLTDLTIKNPYNLATYVGDKTSIMDIKAVDTEGDWYNIEIQIGEHGYYGKRALYYLSKMYVDQLEEGKGFATLHKTIGIHLIDFDYFHDARYRRHFVFKDMETHEYLDHLSYQQLYFVEMSKFRKDWQDAGTLLDRWITFLNKAQQWDDNNIPLPFREDVTMMKAITQLEHISFNKREREIYEAELKARLDDQEELRTAEAKGIVKGLQQGVEQASTDIARKMLREGLPVDIIANVTGLSVDEVTQLQ